jgi:hypothetical protein
VVTFTKPNGLTAAMGTDPTDLSGRTWIAAGLRLAHNDISDRRDEHRFCCPTHDPV